MSGLKYDIENQLCEGQAFTGAATVSEDSYEKQTAAQDLSIGRRMALVVLPTVAAGDEDSVQTLQCIQADNAALTSNVEVLSSVVKNAPDLVPGVKIEIPIPQGSMSKKYIGFRHSATGGVTNTLTADVYLVPQDENDQYKSFPKVNDVSI